MVANISASSQGGTTTGNTRPHDSTPTPSALDHHQQEGSEPLESMDDLATALPTLPTTSTTPGTEGKSRFTPHESSSDSFEGSTNRKLGASDKPLKLVTSALGLVDCEDGSEYGGVELQEGVIQSKRRLGITKFFNASKGFGFILDHDAEELGNAEVFVHYTAIQSVQGGSRAFKSLLEGEEVSYFVSQGPKGWQAQDVTGPTGGPCIGTSPSSPPTTTRSLYTFPRSVQHSSSDSDFRRQQNRLDRRPSGMVSSMSSHNGPRAGPRRDSHYRASSAVSPRETYSNMSSPPSQASSQLPPTPQTPHYYPLPPAAMMFPPQPVFFASPHEHHQALAYYPPPPGFPTDAAGPYYTPSPVNGVPSLPFLIPAYPPPLMTPVEPRQPLTTETEAYPISSSQQLASYGKRLAVANPPPAPSNPYQDLYNHTGSDLHASYGYPISSQAS